MNAEPADLDRLVARWLDGIATDDEAAALSQRIETEPAVRDHVMAMASLHAALAADESLRPGCQDPPLRFRRTEPARPAKPLRWRLAAAALLASAAAWLWMSRQAPLPDIPAFAVDGPVSAPRESAAPAAVLLRAADVVWAGETTTPAVGSLLPPGWLKLRSGTLQIQLLSGALLLLEGPAELRLDNDNAAYLLTGRASAHVPDAAHGFRLLGPGLGVVDLGTAFGMTVDGDRPPEVHVFDGSVTVSTADAPASPRTLAASSAVRIGEGGLEAIPVRPDNFPDGPALARRVAAADDARLAAWRETARTLAADPAALVVFGFDEAPEGSLAVRNEAATAPPESEGILVGASRTAGRWPGKQAIECRSAGDRLRFRLPGSHPAVTLMAWVRPDALANDWNALLLPSHYQSGSLHWNLERGGELRLTQLVNPAAPLTRHGWDGPVSGPAVSPMDFGRWVFLATTCDAASGEVRHYCDGRLVGSGRFPGGLPAAFGDMEFGNWGADGSSPDNAWWRHQPRGHRVRNFTGRLDFLAILARVLPPDEVTAHWEAGRP